MFTLSQNAVFLKKKKKLMSPEDLLADGKLFRED